jgi:hypothetical protein
MRILIAAEDRHRLYADSFGAAFEALRPHLQVLVAELKELDDIMVLLEPEMVICVRSTPVEPAASALAWVELSVEPDRSTNIRVGESSWEDTNPTLHQLLSIADRAEALVKRRSNSSISNGDFDRGGDHGGEA